MYWAWVLQKLWFAKTSHGYVAPIRFHSHVFGNIKPSMIYWSSTLIDMPLRRCFAVTVDVILVEEQRTWSFLAWGYILYKSVTLSMLSRCAYPTLTNQQKICRKTTVMFQGQLLQSSFRPNQGIFFQEGARNTSSGGPGKHVAFFLWWLSLGPGYTSSPKHLNIHNPSPGVPISIRDFYARGPVILEISWNQW